MSKANDNNSFKIDLIAAARPNFMKIAPLYHALKPHSWCAVRLIHTGQHYDYNMSDAFFRDLRLPAPDLHLEIGSGTHTAQTAGVMLAYEAAVNATPPDLTVVVGDVNSTLACALVAAKSHIPVAHLEAGLRCNDLDMPEEVNRQLTDRVSDILWTPSPDADENLIREGIDARRITRVGNIMMDAYESLRGQISANGTRARLGLDACPYGVVTLHRPANVDTENSLTLLLHSLAGAAEKVPLVFPTHPRTRKNLERFGLWNHARKIAGLRIIEPLGYMDFMNVVCGASLVITDSGGIQEETTYLGIPCLTLRPNTERPITITEGTNRLVTPAILVNAVGQALIAGRSRGSKPSLWDGMTASRVVSDIQRRFESVPAPGSSSELDKYAATGAAFL